MESDRRRSRSADRGRGRRKDATRSRSRSRSRSRGERRAAHHRGGRSASRSSSSGSSSSGRSSSPGRRRESHNKRDRHDRSRSRSRSRDRKRHKHGRKEEKERKEKKEKKEKKDKRETSDKRERAPAPAPALPAAAAAAAPVTSHLPPPDAPPKKKAKKGEDDGAAKIAAMFGYTPDNNPFGDANLTETFVWKKKIQREVETGLRAGAPTKAEQRASRDALVDEIERAKARREAREREKEEMERLRAEEARLRDAAQYADWEAKEDEFHRAQTAQRSLIRIREGREKPVDILSKNILLAELCEAGQDTEEVNRNIAADVELHPPSEVFPSLPASELEEMARDVEAFRAFEGKAGKHAGYWAAAGVVVADELQRARTREAGLAAGQSLGALQAVEGEVDAMFAGKDEAGLEDMERSVRDTIAAGLAAAAAASGRVLPGRPAVDVEYWEGVLRHVVVARAKAALARAAEEALLARLRQLEDRKDVFAAAGITVPSAAGVGSGSSSGGAFNGGADGGWELDLGGDAESGTAAAAAAGGAAAPSAGAGASANAGSYSPELIPFDERVERGEAHEAAAAAASAARKGPGALPSSSTVASSSSSSSSSSLSSSSSVAAAAAGSYSPEYASLEGRDSDAPDRGAVGQALPQPDALHPPTSSAASSSSSSSSLSSTGAIVIDAAEDRRRLLERRIAALRASGVLPPAAGTGSSSSGGAGAGLPNVPGGDAGERTFVDDVGRVLPTGFGEADLGSGAEVAVAAGGAGAGGGGGRAWAGGGGGAAAAQPPAHLLLSPQELRAWQDKYRPRKPRFFNRVRTGYDWNKYNKTHYDFDNPPPKTVQGYKFNVFYPDLVDRSRTPRYVLEPADSDEYCIIRFTAGPPYEDVAFKIVNREWETAKKHGFRCSFDRGVLQLHFNFKRMFWRR